jgi:glycosyltransferase involved in cell wall biosynthesis
MANEDYGIGRYSLELAKKILSTDSANSYFLFVRQPKLFEKEVFYSKLNIRIIKADFRHYSFSEQAQFNFLLRKYTLDLVHFMNFNVPVLYTKPFVVTIHDVVHHRLPGNKKKRFLHRLAYKLVINNAASKSRAIITVSNSSKKEIAALLKVPENKIKVIYEAASPVPVSESEVIAVRQKYSLTKPYLIFVGVMERKKNIPLLSKAFDILKETYQQNMQLVLVGKEDQHYPEIINEAKSIRYVKDLVLTGTISDKEKFALYKGAECFVSASKFEGFGLPGVEAMSVGLPLVVSNSEVFNEIYDNGAIYFDADDAKDIAQKINLLLNDKKYKQLIANNAFARSKIFSWDKAAAQTLKVYEEAI